MDIVIGIVGLAIVLVLSLVVRRSPDNVELSLRHMRSESDREELTANAERSRNIPPP